MIFVTGDCHGNFNKIHNFCKKNSTTINDTLVILGDAGLNYFLNEEDKIQKDQLLSLPITIFCIQGNHEERPENIDTYRIIDTKFGKVYAEKEYPNILFGINSNIYNFEGATVLVLGGAYSVDKYYRISEGLSWFPDEQMKEFEKKKALDTLKGLNYNVDYIFSHTCPYNVRPIHLFLKCVDQRTVDNSTEYFLQLIADTTDFKHWFFGHFHDEMDNGKYSMLYNEIVSIDYFKTEEV